MTLPIKAMNLSLYIPTSCHLLSRFLTSNLNSNMSLNPQSEPLKLSQPDDTTCACSVPREECVSCRFDDRFKTPSGMRCEHKGKHHAVGCVLKGDTMPTPDSR
ncbi:hypothetical protein G7K_1775-t1 [Saitoella complicata NRRL Y-17804]|uniref:Uncharacterized protein n=1 Tax=Saitoella complicata (strain BCRC 22490 / CBS 7301 / JCM 7358 / NBRC 10748 / NRRL Y-17804) TaxID=698492 RepID=A0A0E9NCH6_SAICN|nr:hypothetical protein G7K_1775-t1 [Saitoella complicata NRRL Y-17804]